MVRLNFIFDAIQANYYYHWYQDYWLLSPPDNELCFLYKQNWGQHWHANIESLLWYYVGENWDYTDTCNCIRKCHHFRKQPKKVKGYFPDAEMQYGNSQPGELMLTKIFPFVFIINKWFKYCIYFFYNKYDTHYGIPLNVTRLISLVYFALTPSALKWTIRSPILGRNGCMIWQNQLSQTIENCGYLNTLSIMSIFTRK